MTCTAPACTAPTRTASSPYCEAHYYRIRRGSKLGLDPLGTTCRYCDKPVRRRGSFYCSPSCYARVSRGVPKGKQFKPEPALLCATIREWRTVPGFPSYEISNDGRLRRKIAHTNKKAGALIRCKCTSRGYPAYSMSRDGERFKFNAHQIVAWAFLPPARPDQSMVLHADDNKLHCIETNLRWGTAVDNYNDALRNGRIR
jgi:hypothetical protein